MTFPFPLLSLSVQRSSSNPSGLISYASALPPRSVLTVPTPGHPSAMTSRKGWITRSRAIPSRPRQDQCPICIGDELKSYEERMDCFCRVSKMRDHVERTHLRGVAPEEAFSCRHPVGKSQGLVLKHLQRFKSHVQTVHGVRLRE